MNRKKTLHTSQARSSRVQKLQVQCWQIITEVDPNNWVFVNEIGINLAMTRTYARSVKGKRAYGIKSYYRGKNVTLIGAMSLSGFNGVMTIEGGTSGKVFRVYLEKILLPTLKPGSVVVMDNLPAHKVSRIQELIESVGASIVDLCPNLP